MIAIGIATAYTNAFAAQNKTTTTEKPKWYIEGGLSAGYGYTHSMFNAQDWCNSAGCVKGYWETFNYPGDDRDTKIESGAAIAGTVKLGRRLEWFRDLPSSWGAYGDIGNKSDALGIYFEFGETIQFDMGIGVAYNSIFEKAALDMRMSFGYGFKLNDNLLIIPGVFFDFQLSNNGRAEGPGYISENGGACYSCWASGTEMLYYYNVGAKTTLRYSF